MRSNALKKEHAEVHEVSSAWAEEAAADLRRREIAKVAQEACSGPDLEEFAAQYGLNTASNFA